MKEYTGKPTGQVAHADLVGCLDRFQVGMGDLAGRFPRVYLHSHFAFSSQQAVGCLDRFQVGMGDLAGGKEKKMVSEGLHGETYLFLPVDLKPIQTTNRLLRRESKV